MVRTCLLVQETRETCVRSLACEDPLEEGLPTHSSILAWRIPWSEEPGGLQGRKVITEVTLHTCGTPPG